MTAELIQFYQSNHLKIENGEESGLNNEYNRFKNAYTDKYGIGITDSDCCYRINTLRMLERDRWNKVSVRGKLQKLHPCKLGFVKYYHCVIDQTFDPNNKLTISHICGKRLCINGKHMRIETQSDNNKRCTCHNKLIQFEYEFRKDNTINTKGKLIVENIMTAKGLSEGDDNYYKCIHDPICFILIGKC